MKKYFFLWLIIWILIAGAVAIFVEDKNVLLGIGLAAFISLVLMLKTLNEAWTGEIVEIKKERVTVRHGDDLDWEDQTFAYVKLANGKTKKMHPMPDWQVGTKLEKKKGEAQIRKL